MPPAENQVARFLSDVAEIEPPPSREREGAARAFVLPSASSAEVARRKKAKTDPFWDQVVATPMVKPAPSTTMRGRDVARARKRARRRRRLIFLVVGIVLLLGIGLAVAVYTNPGLFSLK
jgi:hypothetical protein